VFLRRTSIRPPSLQFLARNRETLSRSTRLLSLILAPSGRILQQKNLITMFRKSRRLSLSEYELRLSLLGVHLFRDPQRLLVQRTLTSRHRERPFMRHQSSNPQLLSIRHPRIHLLLEPSSPTTHAKALAPKGKLRQCPILYKQIQ
jgi:hypothetical protein